MNGVAAGAGTAFGSVDECVTYMKTLVDGAAYTIGNPEDTTNTFNCKMYHLEAAKTDAALHCPHAQKEATQFCKGPPTKYDNFCKKYQSTCMNGVAAGAGTAFGSVVECVTYMKTLKDGAAYTAVGKSSGDGETFNCKQYHLNAA